MTDMPPSKDSPRTAKLIVCSIAPFFVPAVCVVLALGLMDAQPETQLHKIWLPETGQYYEDQQWLKDIEKMCEDDGAPLDSNESLVNSSSSTGLMLSIPRAGGNHLTRDSLLELNERQKSVEAISLTHNGVTYGYKDICWGMAPWEEPDGTVPFLGYTLPCPKMTVLHAFKEGGWDMGTAENLLFFDKIARPGAIEPQLSTFALAMTDSCKGVCAAAMGEALNLGTMSFKPEKLMEDKTCNACMIQAERATFEALPVLMQAPLTRAEKVSALFDQALTGLKAILGPQYAQLPNEQVLNIALSMFLKVERGKWNLFENLSPSLGLPKGNQALEGATAAQVLEWASDPVHGYLGDTIIYPPENILGSPSPDYGDLGNGTLLTKVQALQTIYTILRPDALVRKMAVRPDSHGGKASISFEEAKEVLEKFKEKMDEDWSRNWNYTQGHTDLNYYYSFFSDSGSKGTFSRKLVEFTEDAVLPSIASYFGIILITTVLLSSCPLTESKMTVGTAGVLLSLVALLAAGGITVYSGTDLSMTMVWTLPFLMVGLGVDDMYVILVALLEDGGNTLDGHIAAMKRVVVPVTMTSFTNLGMFAMLTTIQVPAVREVGKTACYAIVLQWLIMVTAFPCLCYWDMRRQESARADCVPCVRMNRGTPFGNVVYHKVFKPIISSRIAHAVVGVVSLALVVVAAYGCTVSELGVQLGDFFQEGSVELGYFEVRKEHFSTWPVTINFGEIEYTNPDVQMEMIRIYEGVTANRYITRGLATSWLWTASLAKWGTRNCFRVGTAERCGIDFSCEATWREDTKGLKLQTDASDPKGSGVCLLGQDIAEFGQPGVTYEADKKYCPVFAGWSEQKLARCLRDWRKHGDTQDKNPLLDPGYAVDPVDRRGPRLPIRSSHVDAGGNMFNVNLRTVDDYVNAIEETRKICDEVGREDGSMRCWMSGIAYDYWTQYLTLWETAGTIVGLASAMGFVIAFAFLLASFVFAEGPTVGPVGKLVASLAGALLIVVFMMLSLFTVYGVAAVASCNLSVLSIMTYVMSIGFSVEYAVHIVHKFLMAPASCSTSVERVQHAMQLLCLPMGSGFLASLMGILLLLTTTITLVRQFFFAPLVIVQIVTFWYGAWLLPTVLCYVPGATLRVRKQAEANLPEAGAADPPGSSQKI